jgi:hypothetical protein
MKALIPGQDRPIGSGWHLQDGDVHRIGPEWRSSAIPIAEMALILPITLAASGTPPADPHPFSGTAIGLPSPLLPTASLPGQRP